MSHQIFDDLTLCNQVTAEEENAFIVFNTFYLIQKKIPKTSDRVEIIVINIVINCREFDPGPVPYFRGD